MKTYTVTQKGGYQALRTFNKAEAEAKLKELQKHVIDKETWYICEQGCDDEQAYCGECSSKITLGIPCIICGSNRIDE